MIPPEDDCPMPRLRATLILLTLAVSSLSLVAAGPGRHVVLISIDGMRPASYTSAGPAKIPTLRALMARGAHARGVVGVLPSVTYPSHTTMITGVPPAVHGIVNDDGAIHGILEPHDRRHAFARLLAIAATTVVTWLLLARELGASHRFELFLRAVAAICLAFGEPLLDHLAITRIALSLEEGPFIGVEPEPFHAVEDHLHGGGRGALAVGVLDAQDEDAAVTAGVEPAEKRGAHAADVQQAGRARGESRADGHGPAILAR